MDYILTCNIFDPFFNTIERVRLKIKADSLDEAFDSAKSKLARKHKTKADFISITGVERIEPAN